MASTTAAQPAEETLHHLTRLAQKPGVQSTLILSRDTGAIVRASGLVVSDTLAANTAAAADNNSNNVNGSPQSNGTRPPEKKEQQRGGDEAAAAKTEGQQLRSAEEVARSVWRFFAAAGGMVDEMRGEGEDEVRLVRLRMRRSEVMVVPDAKFLLVVIHDTPPA